MKYKNVIGSLIGLALIAYFVYTIDVKAALSHLRTALLPWILAGLMCYLGSMVLRTQKWRIILSDSVEFSHLLAIMFLGWLANYVLPAKSGELYRVHLLKKEGTPYSEGASSVLIERGFDFFALITCAIVLSFAIEETTFYETITYAFLIVFPIVGLVFALYMMRKRISKLQEYLSLFETLSIEKSSTLMVYSIAAWALEILAAYLIFLSIASFPFLPFALGFIIVMLVAAVPSSPGSVGTLEVAWVYAFSVLGLAEEIAGATAILFHVSQYVFILVCGSISFLYLHSFSNSQSTSQDS